MMITEFSCPHGFNPLDKRYEGMAFAAPYIHCLCCGRIQFFVESGYYSTNKSGGTSYVPKDRCDGCGGHYENWEGPPDPEWS